MSKLQKIIKDVSESRLSKDELHNLEQLIYKVINKTQLDGLRLYEVWISAKDGNEYSELVFAENEESSEELVLKNYQDIDILTYGSNRVK